MFDTSLIGDAVSSVTDKFSYGPTPSIIMWSAGPMEEKEDETGLFGGFAKSLESLVTSAVPEKFNSFKFDAMMSEEHEDTSVVTKFPVSSGFLVSEHIIKQNRVLKLTAVASNMQNASMWMASIQGISVATGAIFNNPIIPVIGSVAGTVASAFESSDRVQSTYALFTKLRMAGTKLYVSTILGPYLNCVITSIRCKHDKMTSSILAVEITMEELQTVDKDALAEEARVAMASMYDYSGFAKMAMSAGIGVLGGAPLPGLGIPGDPISKQLSALTDKLAKLASPISSIKGRFL